MTEEEIQSGTAITTAEYNELKTKADRLDELLVIYKRHYGNVVEYAIELQDKAEKWDRLDQPAKYNLTKYMECSDKLEAVKTAYEDHRDNILELSGKLSEIAHDHEIPEEYLYTLEKIATNMISYGELRKILEAEG